MKWKGSWMRRGRGIGSNLIPRLQGLLGQQGPDNLYNHLDLLGSAHQLDFQGLLDQQGLMEILDQPGLHSKEDIGREIGSNLTPSLRALLDQRDPYNLHNYLDLLGLGHRLDFQGLLHQQSIQEILDQPDLRSKEDNGREIGSNLGSIWALLDQ